MVHEWAARRWRMAAAVVIVALALGVPSAAATAAGFARQRIVALAEQELGYRDHGALCTKFGPCELWCSLFVTWVWERAGVAVPSLAFTGYLYDWARATTSVQGRAGVPQPGDAVLFGSGPSSVATSVHTGIVEAVYPGYLVTIEGDVLHGVRRFVVPIRHPQLVGEPGPIYAYAAPVAAAGAARTAMAASALAFRRLPVAVIARQHARRHPSLEMRRLRRAIAALRAFQHMPYRTPQVSIDWTGVDPRGLVEVRVATPLPMSQAIAAWQAFLRRYGDAGQAYAVTFQAPPDPASTTSTPAAPTTTTSPAAPPPGS